MLMFRGMGIALRDLLAHIGRGVPSMTTRGLLLMTAWLLVCGLVASPRIPRFWPGPAGRSLLGRSPYACDSNEVAPCVSSFLRSAGYAPTIVCLVWSACMRCGLRFVLVPLAPNPPRSHKVGKMLPSIGEAGVCWHGVPRQSHLWSHAIAWWQSSLTVRPSQAKAPIGDVVRAETEP